MATDEEIEKAGWAGDLSVTIIVLVTGPPALLPEGKPVTIGATTTERDAQTDRIHAYLALKRRLGGVNVTELVLRPAAPASSFEGIPSERQVVGTARSSQSDAVPFMGSLQRRRSAPGEST